MQPEASTKWPPLLALKSCPILPQNGHYTRRQNGSHNYCPLTNYSGRAYDSISLQRPKGGKEPIKGRMPPLVSKGSSHTSKEKQTTRQKMKLTVPSKTSYTFCHILVPNTAPRSESLGMERCPFPSHTHTLSEQNEKETLAMWDSPKTKQCLAIPAK